MKPSKHNCNLDSCFFCKGCLPEWKPAIAANKSSYTFKKGETIFREGDKVDGIYFIEKGLAKVHMKWDQDKELILRFAKDGNIIGHRGLGSDERFPVSATALEATTTCFIPISFFLATLRVNHQFTFDLMLFYARELKDSERKMRNLVHMPVKNRLAYALLFLHDKFGIDSQGWVDIRLARQDIASFAGTTYETVFRTLQEFTNNKWLETDGRSFRILNTGALQSLATMQHH